MRPRTCPVARSTTATTFSYPSVMYSVFPSGLSGGIGIGALVFVSGPRERNCVHDCVRCGIDHGNRIAIAVHHVQNLLVFGEPHAIGLIADGNGTEASAGDIHHHYLIVPL